MERVKFYSASDWSCGYNLEKLYEVLNNYDDKKEDYDINEIIEFYNMTKFIENECFLVKWSEKERKQIKNGLPKLKATIGKFCANINNTNFIDLFNNIDKENFYQEDFFELIEKYNVYVRIDNEQIEELLENNFLLNIILKNKKIVNKYGETIKKKFLENPENATILLDKYEIDEREREIYLPKELSKEDEEDLIVKYINSENANLNYLRVIENIQSSKDGLIISDKTRLLTKRTIKKQTDEFFKNNQGMKTETLVQFCHKKQEDVVKFECDGKDIKCSYDLNWIKENTDYPTLLNNFIYLFFYTDMQMRISLTSKKRDLGIFERHIFINSKKAYKKGVAFDRMALLSDLQMMGYYERLKEIDIRLEEIIEWFFKEYLKDEFNIKDFRISMPSKESTTLEKCRTVLSEMDHILKEYQLIVEDGKIDHELIEISSNPISFKDIKSLVNHKYIYENSDEFKRVEHCFFSDQCMLHYIKRINKTYKSFYDLINSEKIKRKDYKNYAEREIEFLLNGKYIKEDEQGYLIINKVETIKIFKDLHDNEVINYWKYSDIMRKEIDKLIANEILICLDSLLSKPEIDYYNYYLNKSEFNNGMDLRNKYIHGTQPSSDDAEKEHKYNYMIFLKLFILLIIKINDELCTINSQKYISNNKK